MEVITIPFSVGPGEVVNVAQLLDNDSIEDDPSYKGSGALMSQVLKNVQSKIGKVVPGYDEGDDFIDDSEIADRSSEAQEIDPSAFVVRLYTSGIIAEQKRPSTPTKARKEEEQPEDHEAIDQQLTPFMDAIRVAACTPIQQAMEKINEKSKSLLKIQWNKEISDGIIRYIDEKIRLETERSPNPTGRKVQQWKKDAIEKIFSTCFVFRTYQFTTTRNISQIYAKAKKEAV